MMKLFITAGAIFFCTLTTQAFAECEPDRNGNIIDLGDGLCQSLPSQTELPKFPHDMFFNSPVIEAYKERIPPTLIGGFNTWAIEDRWLYQVSVSGGPTGGSVRYFDCLTSWGFEFTATIPSGSITILSGSRFLFRYEFPRSYGLTSAGREILDSFNTLDQRLLVALRIPEERFRENAEVYARMISLDEEDDRRDLCRYMGLTPGF